MHKTARHRPAVSLPRDLVRSVRALDTHQLRRLAILVGGLLHATASPHPGAPAGVTYRQASVRCGKDCAACPHGPYWYAHWREDGRARSQYIGRDLPDDVRQLLAADAEERRRTPETG